VLRRIAIAFLVILALGAAGVWWKFLRPRPYQVTYTFADVKLADFTAGPAGELWFRGFHAAGTRDLLEGGRNAVAEPVVGVLVLPEGASAAAPVPAMVILHGSGGDFTGRSENLAKKLAAVGIAGFAVDTFRSRRLPENGDYFERLEKAGIYTQMADGYNAFKALQQHPAIRHDQVGVLGFSLGAASALLMQFEPVSRGMLGEGGPRFAAHVSFYSGCTIDFEEFRTAGAPVLLTYGTQDESINPAACRRLRERLEKIGVYAELHAYEGAGHGWDLPEPMTYEKDAFVLRDCVVDWRRDGSVIEPKSGYDYSSPFVFYMAFRKCATTGYTIGRNDAANRQSVRDLVQFLDRAWHASRAAALNDAILSIGIPPEPMREGVIGKP
jgi:dienelactone hydrolase